MLIRRGFLTWLTAAAVVLPIWLGIGWAIFGGGGWGTLGLVVAVPVAFIALAVVALIVWIRPTVRSQRAASWTDVGVIGAWHLAIIATGFYGASATLFGVLAILLAIASFWIGIWQLISDGARRMQATMTEFERLAAQQAGASIPPDAAGGTPGRGSPFGGDDVIIVREQRDETK
ncbi:hypothetical protein [Agromyces sp. Marseille-P2726]|uniref:hypothetical protein n=1 Tax=Agromyces sp. Marseille-P2726 TaxID=2709132 RepID=UPI00157138A9|nr:hypothetical protein [Agromyces sp. Marseille-P2726]